MAETQNKTQPRGVAGASAGSALPEWMDTPEKRRRIWALQALVAASFGDEERAEEYMQHALQEDARCAVPIAQDDQALPRGGVERTPGASRG